MTLSAVKTLALASALVLLSSLSDSVDARNQSAAVTHHHKHHEKANKCKKCSTEVDLSMYSYYCYHEFPSHNNVFFGKWIAGTMGAGFYEEKICNCCNDPVKYKNGKPEHWHLIYEKDVTWCYSKKGKDDAKKWYDNLKKVCD